MQRSLPNLDWLKVFAACAATESFALAAAQLNVTPGAVSQRMKALESFLGVSLFQRYAQGVRLTETGKKYAASVTSPLDRLAAATREITQSDTARPVKITILPALAQLWLGPRLDDYHRQHEGTSVEIWADPTIVDLRSSSFDLAIRYGKPPFPGCDHRALLFDEIVPVASPALAQADRLDALGLPIGVPLLLDTYWSNDFDNWIEGAGERRPPNLTLQTFSLYSMVVEATLHGRGFMMGHTSLVSDLVDQGKLVYLSEKRAATTNQFYLLTRNSSPTSSSAETFIEWLLAQ